MKHKIIISISFISVLLTIGCKKLVEVDGPTTSVNSANIYAQDATAISVMTGIYTSLSATTLQEQKLGGICFYTGLSSDELRLVGGFGNETMTAYYTNALNSQIAGYEFWNNLYADLYVINAAIEGVSGSKTLTPSVQQQLLGEAKFMRAFCFFYLVNLYGNIPLILTTDYKTNSLMSRTPKDQVWVQIIDDLRDAEGLLSENYLDGTLLKTTDQRVRPTKWAATALLSRVFLYTKNWKEAETKASVLITQSKFNLESLGKVFLKNSREAIWQLQPVYLGNNTQDALGFIISDPNYLGIVPVVLSESLLDKFEIGDQRKVNWTNFINIDGIDYIYAYKYKKANRTNDPNFPIEEFSVVFRLAEQYLIRAEARIEEGRISEGLADINIIRDRATDKSEPQSQQLRPLSLNLSKQDAILALEHERQIELFTESGHRWLDLKRTARVDQVMSIETPKKSPGNTWKTYQQWYPIWYTELQRAPNVDQNEGY